jgi:hypothetical protein
MIKIDKNIPIYPRKVQDNNPERKYQWSKMNIGDSFLMDVSTIFSARAIAHRAGIKLGFKFVCRHDKSGFRVWRTE